MHIAGERSSRHGHFNLNDHLVFTPKDRRRSFFGPSRDRLMEIFTATCAERDWLIRGMEVMPDHVHLFLSCPPKWAPSDIAKILKGVSARLLLQAFPELKRRVGATRAKHVYAASDTMWPPPSTGWRDGQQQRDGVLLKAYSSKATPSAARRNGG
ncbi:hypothetical protein GCM10008957_54740 [Deinococcus ruber]|uniref:Transposase IS200-like domain-containing protein n=2 Tax=Deinococcus ruber TaxID=1848197 RepID=A0A918KX68_9DEIO|nr:hypothetical protein GCM10008957_54740 [Deinococcus ruber]